MRILLVLFILFFVFEVSAQTFSGQIKDASSGEFLGGVIIEDSLSGISTRSNVYGFFSLTLPSSKAVLRFSLGSYTSLILRNPKANEVLQIQLNREVNLEEIKVSYTPKTKISGNPLSLSISDIRNMPTLLGEADVLKAFTYTPGVSSGNEGSAGIYVRGGTPDQNLILLDGVPVYNAMHLGGFFSVFNPASLKNAELYKGAFPARFGGRLSSIIDLTMKEGNNKEFKGEVGLGLMNQSLTLEGPIIKDKASFIVSGRISTLGFTNFLTKSRKKNNSGEDYIYNFHDLNAKFNYQISKTDHLFLSFYNGFDRFKYEEWSVFNGGEVTNATGNNWGNNTGTLRYSKMLSPKLFSRATLIYSNYLSQFTNEFKDSEGMVFRDSDTKITDLGTKVQFDYFLNKNIELRTGFDLTQHQFKPFAMKSNYEGFYNEPNRVSAFQTNLFVDADLHLSSKVKLNAGLRFNNYDVKGKNFANLEPRLSANYNFAKNWNLYASATQMNQYVHLLVNNGYGFGYDAWLPATAKIPPSSAKQWSLGLSKILEKSKIEFTLEAYQKRMNNLIDYPEGTNFAGLVADNWENIVKSGGKGRGQGLEFMAARNTGKLQGRLSYTWSKMDLQFDEINTGKWYPMRYDRRHNLNLNAQYAFSKKWSINAAFIYQTGHAVTTPVGAYLDGYNVAYIYKDRNNGRMPDFHRLDIGATRYGSIWKDRKTKLSFGLYNAYNRANPLYLDYKRSWNQENRELSTLSVKQYSMFPILPYINYTISF